MITGAGIMFLAPKNEVLFLKRGHDGSHAGEWCFPGGTTEPGESAGETAEREAREEIGSTFPPGDKRAFWTRREKDGVDFTTFVQPVSQDFEPELNDEHTGFCWRPASNPPQPLHPGCQIALKRLRTDELELAEAIRDGELVSPYRYENISLVNMRITGTGTSYRKALKEFVYRPEEVYLNDRFLQRCNGLAVILEHPKGNALNSKEFNDRVVGTILLPYIKGSEVWGIAKIYDDSAREMLEEETLSTSPAVVFRDPSVNEKVTLDDGSALLIEGKPSLLDHLAICERGVWDKGGEPTGVTSVDATTYGDSNNMTDEEKAAQAAADKQKADAEAAKAKADADAGEKLDRLLSCMDSITKRMDSLEEKNAKKDATRKDGDPDPALDDPEQVAADKAKKDAEEKAKKDADEEASKKAETEKADKAKKDAEDIKARLDEMDKKIPQERSDEEAGELADAQAKADSVASMFGKSAGRPLNGEGLLAYRKRQLKQFQPHSKAFKDFNIGILDAKSLEPIEAAIYADAMAAAKSPTDLPLGTLREIRQADRTGRVVSTFAGDMNSWMGDFKSPKRRLVGIRNADSNR